MAGHEWTEIGTTTGQWDNVSIWACPRCGAQAHSYVEPDPMGTIKLVSSILPAYRVHEPAGESNVWRALVDSFGQRFPGGATCEEAKAWLAEVGYPV